MSFALAPLESLTFPDVLAATFGLDEGFGAVQVSSGSKALLVGTRTFTGGPGGTVGANVPGVPLSSFFSDDATAVLIGLVEDDAFRSNLVLVNASPEPITLRVSASDAGGVPLGERSYRVPALGMIQDSRFLLRPELGGEARSLATVTVSSETSGALFTALASVIDNTSNDPTTVLPQAAGTASDALDGGTR